MKKIVCLLLAALMLFGATAMAKETAFYAKGSVAAPQVQYILAPMGGQVANFTLNGGDQVTAGQVAFTLAPTTVYAANDGTITGLNARPGDSAQAVIGQYGALCYIERDNLWQVNATTEGGYSDKKNRDIRIGATLRGQAIISSEKYNGTGKVIAAEGKAFTVELEKGDFELEDTVKFYLGTGKEYASKDYVGSGKVSRAAQIPVQGTGVVAKVLVEDGQAVTRGQALFLLDSDTAVYKDNAAMAEVVFTADALVAQVLVTPGQYVIQGQAVLAVYPKTALEATLEVDELDIAGVKEGQIIRVTVDSYPDKVRTAMVKEITPLGVTVLDTTKFMVKITFENSDDLMIGMHIKGYWEE